MTESIEKVETPRALGEPGAVGSRDVACATGCGRVVTQTWIPPFGKITAGWRPDPAKCETCRGIVEEDEVSSRLEAERQTGLRDLDLAERVRALAVPPIYREVELSRMMEHGDETSKKAQREIKARSRDFVAEWDRRTELPIVMPMLLVFYGPPGTGKTGTAWAIAKELVQNHGAKAIVTKFNDLVTDIRGAWDRAEGGISEAKRLARYRDADLLVIDEVSAHAQTGDPESKRQHLYDVVAYREEWMRPTIITTNEETEKSLGDLIGAPVLSRAARYDGLWFFGTADFRVTLRRTFVRRRNEREKTRQGDGKAD